MWSFIKNVANDPIYTAIAPILAGVLTNIIWSWLKDASGKANSRFSTYHQSAKFNEFLKYERLYKHKMLVSELLNLYFNILLFSIIIVIALIMILYSPHFEYDIAYYDDQNGGTDYFYLTSQIFRYWFPRLYMIWVSFVTYKYFRRLSYVNQFIWYLSYTEHDLDDTEFWKIMDKEFGSRPIKEESTSER